MSYSYAGGVVKNRYLSMDKMLHIFMSVALKIIIAVVIGAI